MVDMPVARRMRRFRAPGGTEYDETLDGQLRRRLPARSKSPIPHPQSWDEVEAAEGPLVEVTAAELERYAKAGQRRRRGCRECGKTSCWGECTPGRRKGRRK